MKLIPRSDYQRKPWKNGQGFTEEIAVDPQQVWRLSAASISVDSSFSDYTGFRRYLAVWQGEGLLLNQHELRFGEIYTFSGDEKIFCRLLKGPVVDLGLIYDPHKCQAEMRFVSEEKFSTLKADVNFIFCAQGYAKFNGIELNAGDTVELLANEKFQISGASRDLKLILIEITRIA